MTKYIHTVKLVFHWMYLRGDGCINEWECVVISPICLTTIQGCFSQMSHEPSVAVVSSLLVFAIFLGNSSGGFSELDSEAGMCAVDWDNTYILDWFMLRNISLLNLHNFIITITLNQICAYVYIKRLPLVIFMFCIKENRVTLSDLTFITHSCICNKLCVLVY